MELDLVKIAENFGFPALVLVFVGLALRSIARFFAPLITSSFTRFFGMMDSTTESLVRHTESMNTHTQLLSGIKDELNNQSHTLDVHGEKLDSHGLLLSEIRGIYVKKDKPGDSGILKA
jgi:hypothetical protein